MRIALWDDRVGDKRATPIVRLAALPEWRPSLSSGGDHHDFGGRDVGATDTLFIYPLGRDIAAFRVPLTYGDSLCPDACPRDMVRINVSDDSVDVVGRPVIGTEARVAIRTLRAAAPPGIGVSRRQLGTGWPLTVENGWVDCIDGRLLVFRTRARAYALNGMARSAGYSEIEPIWRPNPEIDGARISLHPLFEVAERSCPAGRLRL